MSSTAELGRCWTPTLADGGEISFATDLADARRHELTRGAWVDHLPEWLSGSAAIFDELVTALSWREPDVLMYGQIMRQPRRSAWLSTADLSSQPGLDTAGPVLQQARRMLEEHYGVGLATTGVNLYRTGSDSVAWHGDSGARERLRSTIAIISLGSRRPFRLRPTGGGPSLGFELGHGDLLVMGGTCQRTWQHCVPKVARAAARISVTFREHAERPGPVRRR